MLDITDTEALHLGWARQFVTAHIDRANLIGLLTGTGADHNVGGPLIDRDPGMMRAELIGVAQSRVQTLLDIIDRMADAADPRAAALATHIDATPAEVAEWAKRRSGTGA